MQILWGSPFNSKCLKFSLNFKNAAENWKKYFCFSDNCAGIGVVKCPYEKQDTFHRQPVC